MAELELRSSDGRVERRELSRTQPLSVGQQSFNDVSIPDDGVGALHCRIGWNKSGYEVTAAVKEGVDVNGKLVQHALLKTGDVLRIGSMDFVFRDSAMPRTDRGTDGEKDQVRAAGSGKSAADKTAKPSRSKRDKGAGKGGHDPDANELSLFEGPVIAESMAEMFADPEVLPDSSDEMSAVVLSRMVSDGETISRGGVAVGTGQERPLATELKRTVKAALAANRVRPGEQDIFKSPLVLGLGGGGLIILLVTATIWFLMGRQVATRHFEQGVAELNDAKYSQAILTLESFIEKYPKHALTTEARLKVGDARIQKELSGATPNWKRGVEELEKFVKEYQNDAEFAAMKPGICKFAEQIALGSVKTAEAVKDPELLVVSADATRRMENFSDPQQPPTVALEQIREGTEKAKAAIRKQQTFDAAFVIIDQALKNKQPITALRERARLLQVYPDYVTQRRVRETLQQSIAMEKAVIAVEDLDRKAVAASEPAEFKDCVLPIYHTRSRTDESASGRYAYAVAQDACYAVDVVTGETAWRRIIGFETPFFPILTSGAQPGLLIGETNKPGMALCHAETGALIWRQPMDAPVAGAPLVHDGEIFVAGAGHCLYRLDLDTGRMKAKMTFSQEVVGPPTLAPGGNHLLISGETSLLYGLSIRPLEVTSVTFTSHPARAVAVPLLTMGSLVLMCENDQLDSCRLRCWDASQPKEPLTEASNAVRIEGQVVDRPVLRGSQLVVVSTGERLNAYAVSDNPEKKGLAFIGLYKVQDGYAGPMQLALGPDQQFWLGSSAFRKFQVLNDSIRLDQNSTAPGISSQPLQIIGDQFFVGRRPPYAEGVVFTQVDRERMAGSWRTVLGARWLAWTEARTGGLIGVSETGSVFTLATPRLQQAGVELRAGVELDIPPDVIDPLNAARLSDGRLALWCGGSQSRLWLINAIGQVESEHKLDAPLTAAPVLLKGGLVLPQSGRLKWLSQSRDVPRVQDYAAPVVDGGQVRWAFLAGLDEKEFVTCDTAGRLSRMQIRQDDVVHLGEAAKFALPQPVDVPMVLVPGELWVADAGGTVRRLDSRSFDVKAERTFPSPVIGLWAVGPDRFVQLRSGKLHCLTEADGLPDRWSAEMGTAELLDAPVRRGEHLVWVSRGGAVFQLDAATGKETGRSQLPQPLSLGLISVGETLFASAADGAIYRVTPPPGANP